MTEIQKDGEQVLTEEKAESAVAEEAEPAETESEEIPVEETESEQENSPDAPKKPLKRRWAAPLGVAILALALVGALSVLGFCVRTVGGWIESARQKTYTEYAEFIQPVVLYDPKPFDSLADAQPEDLIKAAYWAAQLAHNQSSEVDYEVITLPNGGVRYRMPMSEILSQGRRLFGIDLTPSSFSIDGVLYEYDNVSGQLLAPLNNHNGLYSPKVTAVKKTGPTTVELTVDYISTTAVGKDPAPVKTMIYTLRKDQDAMTVTAIGDVTP